MEERTSARYTLLPLGERTDVVEAPSRFPTLRRDDWNARLRVLEVGTSVEIKVQGSYWGNDDADWVDLFAKTYNATETDLLEKGADWDTDPGSDFAWLRAIVPSHDGEYVAEVVAWSPIFSPSTREGDLELLTKELREGLNSRDRARVIYLAESMILTRKLDQDDRGTLRAAAPEALTTPLALTSLKRAIALQADYLLRRELLANSEEPSALVTLRKQGEFAEGVDDLLKPFLSDVGGLRWRHR